MQQVAVCVSSLNYIFSDIFQKIQPYEDVNKPALRWVQSVPGIPFQYYGIFFLHVILLGKEQVMMYFKLFIMAWKNCGQF